MNLEENVLKEIGIHEYGLISTAEIPFDHEIRKICQNNVCRLYGTTWACPPAVGTIEECQARCLQYKTALVFNAVYPLDSSFDYKGMMQGHSAFKDLCDRLYTLVKPQLHKFLLLSNEGCKRCKSCTYPSAPCRQPERLFPSLEGFGIYVAKLASCANIKYVNGKNTVTYFGLLLYNLQNSDISILLIENSVAKNVQMFRSLLF